MKVFFYEVFEEETEQLRHHLPVEIEASFTDKTIQEYSNKKAPAPFISIRTQSEIPLEWCDALQAILTRSTGYDHIQRYWRACGKKVCSGFLPLYCNRAVAEQALLLWLALLRKLPQQMKQFHTFHRDGLTGREMENKTLAVVGVGYIGSEVVRVGKALGMRVIGVDIVQTHKDLSYLPIEEALPQADIIVCAMNLTEENRGYFSYERLKSTPPGSIFVNITRGEHSPCTVLLKLIDEGHLGGVALDVFDQESLLAATLRQGTHELSVETQATLSLAQRPNVILTPHNAFNTSEAVVRKARQTVEQILHFGRHGRFLWSVEE